MTAGPDGGFWFTDGRYGTISRLGVDGTVTPMLRTIGASDPGAIALGPDGAFWFTLADDEVGRFTMTDGYYTFPAPRPGHAPTASPQGPTAPSESLRAASAGSPAYHGRALPRVTACPPPTPGPARSSSARRSALFSQPALPRLGRTASTARSRVPRPHRPGDRRKSSLTTTACSVSPAATRRLHLDPRGERRTGRVDTECRPNSLSGIGPAGPAVVAAALPLARRGRRHRHTGLRRQFDPQVHAARPALTLGAEANAASKGRAGVAISCSGGPGSGLPGPSAPHRPAPPRPRPAPRRHRRRGQFSFPALSTQPLDLRLDRRARRPLPGPASWPSGRPRRCARGAREPSGSCCGAEASCHGGLCASLQPAVTPGCTAFLRPT